MNSNYLVDTGILKITSFRLVRLHYICEYFNGVFFLPHFVRCVIGPFLSTLVVDNQLSHLILCMFICKFKKVSMCV